MDDQLWEIENLTPETLPIARHARAIEVRAATVGPARVACGGHAFSSTPTRLELPLPFVHGTSRCLLEELVNNPGIQCRICEWETT